MAPGRIQKWFKSFPLPRGDDAHRARQSDISGVTSAAVDATTTARDFAGDVASLVPAQIEADSTGSPATTEAAAAATLDLTGDVASPVPAQIEVITQASVSSGHAYRLDTEMAKEYMANIKRFRVLVMGRANAGKTTILQRVCNSKDKPETYDGKGNKIDGVVLEGSEKRGYHHIEYELRFQSNPRLAFHDSCGFEAGSPKQFDEMKGFVVDHAAIARSVNNRIHAIWYCIPMTDCQRTVTAAEKKFFDECDTGHVPVIVLLTKCDTLNLDAIQELEDEGLEVGEVQQRIPKKERELLEKWLGHLKKELDNCNFPPRGYVPLQNMHQENVDCNVLMQCTANLLNEKSLQKLLISTQQSSIALCVEYAVNKTLREKMELGQREGFQVDVKMLENALLSWFPNCEGYSDWERRCRELHWEWLEEGGEQNWEKLSRLGWELEERELLWDNVNELPSFEVNTNTPMPPITKDVTLLGKFSTVQSIAEHAIACLLVAEHSYFLMQHGQHVWKEILSSAVEEYKISSIQTVVSSDVKAAFHDCNGNMEGLCKAIINIIIKNRMSNNLLKKQEAKKVHVGEEHEEVECM